MNLSYNCMNKSSKASVDDFWILWIPIFQLDMLSFLFDVDSWSQPAGFKCVCVSILPPITRGWKVRKRLGVGSDVSFCKKWEIVERWCVCVSFWLKWRHSHLMTYVSITVLPLNTIRMILNIIMIVVFGKIGKVRTFGFDWWEKRILFRSFWRRFGLECFFDALLCVCVVLTMRQYHQHQMIMWWEFHWTVIYRYHTHGICSLLYVHCVEINSLETLCKTV